MRAADIRAVSTADQTQSSFDLFLVFVGANIVATTCGRGGVLRDGFERWDDAALAASMIVYLAARRVSGTKGLGD